MRKQRTFFILSNIVSKDDVFNNLVLVEDTKTGEQGKLLCSHGCNWPEELIPLATWLEGCYTPGSYQNSPKLALGYHPQSVTEWWVNENSKTLTIEADMPVDGMADSMSIPFQWLGYDEVEFTFDRRLKAAWRLFSRSHINNTSEPEEKLAAFSRTILCGRIDLPPVAGHFVYKVVEDFEDMRFSFSREGVLNMTHLEYNHGSVFVVENDKEQGFAEAENFPYVFDEGVEVTRTVGPYAVAWDLPYERSTSDCGYTKPIVITAKYNLFSFRYRRTFRQRDDLFLSDKFPVGALVINTDEYHEYGFHFAIPIN